MRNAIGAFLSQIAALGFTGGPFINRGWKQPRAPMRPCPDCNKPTRGVFDPKGKRVSSLCYGCLNERIEHAAPVDLPSQSGTPSAWRGMNNPTLPAVAGNANHQYSVGRAAAGE